MKQIKYHKYHQLATYCKSEGMDVDYFMTANRIMTNRNYWTKDTNK